MSNYDDLPCSIYQTPRLVLPKVVEVTPQQPAEAVADSRKKSCLSAPNPRKEKPFHPGLRPKVVAFGKTVNVSQTVEATSRAVKKAMNSTNSATSSPMQLQKNDTENKENREDVLKIIQEQLEATRREIREENAKRQEELNEQNLKKMQDMMSSFFQQIAVSKPPPAVEKEEKPRPINRIGLARQKVKKEGKIPPEALEILEKRLLTDPLFRQTIDDVLADAEYESEKGGDQGIRRYSPPPVSYAPYQGGANPSKLMTETLTVERSVRFDNGLESIDQRRKTTQWSDRERNRYRDYSPDQVLHSTYQPGSSVSYYPSQRANDYYVEHVEDVNSDIEEYPPERRHETRETRGETKEERERRIREKYRRRN